MLRRVAALTLLVALRSHAAGLPTFEDYPVSRVYHGAVKPPIFGIPDRYSGTELRCFDNPSSYAREKVNFAGHFVIAACTCGSGCHYLFMWDARTGGLYRDFPFASLNVRPYDAKGYSIGYKGEQHVPNSSLLIVEGCIEDSCDCATRYYHWNGRKFQLLIRKQAPIPPGCSH